MSEKKSNEKKNQGFPNFGGPKKDGKDPKKGFSMYWIYVLIGVVLIGVNLLGSGSSLTPISLAEFEGMAQKNIVNNVVVVNKEFARVYIRAEQLEQAKEIKKISDPMIGSDPKSGPHYRLNILSPDKFSEQLYDWSKEYNFTYESRTEKNWGTDIIGWLLPIAIMVAIWIFIMRRMSGGGGPGGQIFNIGKSRAKLFDPNTEVKVTFDDVAGQDGAKEEVQEIVEFLKSPKKYTDLGARIPKGALLIGPPGTGKTLLAKAVAGEAKVPFFSLSGSDFVEMFVGVGASRVRDLFKQAKEKSPSIIFIDEIDAIGRARGKSMQQGANDERENTLNQLLTEMDGFGMNSGVIILAASNRPDILDKALLRPGRFDRRISVDMPDLNERKQIFKVHLKPIKLAEDMDVHFLAKQTPGFSGADIANVCNEAALIAARHDKKHVERQDFLDAMDRVIAGLEKKSKVITPKERKTIAYHEAGHATVSWFLEHASPLVKVTIVPRGQSLGAAWYLPEERQITTTEQLIDEMCAALGGRAAEQVIFGKISTGALSDLEKVTKQAYNMITVYGLNEKVGNISFYDSTGRSEYAMSKPYSEKTAELIDQEVKAMIDAAYQRTIKILEEHRDVFVKLAERLLEKEVIFRADLEELLGERPFKKEGFAEKDMFSKDQPKTTQPTAKSEDKAPGNGAESTKAAEKTSEEKIASKDSGEDTKAPKEDSDNASKEA